jgi:SAM-dependent methyltransferase
MRLLHAGCGSTPLPPFMAREGCEEVRLDIDPETKPDIVASLTDLGEIGPFDAVYCSHCVEHLYPKDVRVALAEFYRVTAPGGFALVIVPDLEGVQATEEVLFECPGGPLAGLDLIYGCRFDMVANPYMAHHSGFVSSTLESAMKAAGFDRVTMKRLPDYNLMAVGQRKE